jgi:hypothetical protein
MLDPMPLYDNSGKYKSTEESHDGCFGAKRKGTKNMGGEGAVNPLVNVVEVCDVAVLAGADGADHLIVATDFGPFYYTDVDKRIADCDAKTTPNNTCGNRTYAMQGGTKDNVLFGKVVNRLATAKSGDSTIVIAATSDGVYVNSAKGDPKAWQQMDKAGLSGAVNAVAVSGATIYAGTDKGLFKSSGLEASSTFLPVTVHSTASAAETVAVKALAVDATDLSTLYIGTKTGLKVARGCTTTVADVAADVGEVRNIAAASEGTQTVVAVASSKGLFVSVGTAATSSACSATAPAKEDPVKPGNVAGSGTVAGPGTTPPSGPK